MIQHARSSSDPVTHHKSRNFWQAPGGQFRSSSKWHQNGIKMVSTNHHSESFINCITKFTKCLLIVHHVCSIVWIIFHENSMNILYFDPIFCWLNPHYHPIKRHKDPPFLPLCPPLLFVKGRHVPAGTGCHGPQLPLPDKNTMWCSSFIRKN